MSLIQATVTILQFLSRILTKKYRADYYPLAFIFRTSNNSLNISELRDAKNIRFDNMIEGICRQLFKLHVNFNVSDKTLQGKIT